MNEQLKLKKTAIEILARERNGEDVDELIISLSKRENLNKCALELAVRQHGRKYNSVLEAVKLSEKTRK